MVKRKFPRLFDRRDGKGNRGRESAAKTIARGAAGLSIALGIVAGAAALLDRDMRQNLAKGAKRAARTMRKTAKGFGEIAQERYQVTAHQLRSGRRSRKKMAGKKGGRI